MCLFGDTVASLTLSGQHPNSDDMQQPSWLGPCAGCTKSGQHPHGASLQGVAFSQPLYSGPLALVSPSGQHPCFCICLGNWFSMR